MERDTQIALIEQLAERREEMVREWKADVEFKQALHRYDHEFDEKPRRIATR